LLTISSKNADDGEDIYIIQSKKLTAVRPGPHVIDENKFLKDIIHSVEP
jgi:hypothetical protein